MEVVNLKEFMVICPKCGATLKLNSEDISTGVCLQNHIDKGVRGYSKCGCCGSEFGISRKFKAIDIWK